MPIVKFVINEDEPEAVDLAQQMRAEGLRFNCVPTSGPISLWVDGDLSQGPTEVHETARLLMVERQPSTERFSVARV